MFLIVFHSLFTGFHGVLPSFLSFHFFPLIFSLLGLGFRFFTYAFLSPPITFSMVDDVPHDDAPFEAFIPPSAAGVKDPMLEKADSAAEDIAADIATGEIYLSEPKPELPPLRVRPFDPVTYYLCIHATAPSGILRFQDFARGVPQGFLL